MFYHHHHHHHHGLHVRKRNIPEYIFKTYVNIQNSPFKKDHLGPIFKRTLWNKISLWQERNKWTKTWAELNELRNWTNDGYAFKRTKRNKISCCLGNKPQIVSQSQRSGRSQDRIWEFYKSQLASIMNVPITIILWRLTPFTKPIMIRFVKKSSCSSAQYFNRTWSSCPQ